MQYYDSYYISSQMIKFPEDLTDWYLILTEVGLQGSRITEINLSTP